MPTRATRITWILYNAYITSVFDFDCSCCERGAVTPLQNTDSKPVISMIDNRRSIFEGTSSYGVVSFPEAPSITHSNTYFAKFAALQHRCSTITLLLIFVATQAV